MEVHRSVQRGVLRYAEVCRGAQRYMGGVQRSTLRYAEVHRGVQRNPTSSRSQKPAGFLLILAELIALTLREMQQAAFAKSMSKKYEGNLNNSVKFLPCRLHRTGNGNIPACIMSKSVKTWLLLTAASVWARPQDTGWELRVGGSLGRRPAELRC